MPDQDPPADARRLGVETEALLERLARADHEGARRAAARLTGLVERCSSALPLARIACYEALRALHRLRRPSPRADGVDWDLAALVCEPRAARDLAKVFSERFAAGLDALPRGDAHPLILRACRFIEQRALGRLSLADVARELGVSAGYLSSLFTRKVGMTLTRYIHEQRLARAEPLLRTDRPLNEIARELGYGSYRHFHRTFVRLRGVSPGAYRRQAAAGGRRERTAPPGAAG